MLAYLNKDVFPLKLAILAAIISATTLAAQPMVAHGYGLALSIETRSAGASRFPRYAASRVVARFAASHAHVFELVKAVLTIEILLLCIS